MPGLRVEHLNKSFGSNQVLFDISLDIKEREFFVLLGPSGCGKSTLLRSIAGLETVDSGRIFIDNKDITGLEPGERNIAMVFQNYALYPHMTVFENLAFPLKLRGLKKKDIEVKVRDVSKMLEIDRYLAKRPGQLSGGEKQRVAVGRALVRDPSLFLFDEPLSNIDAKLRAIMRAEISRLHKRIGITTVYVTHDQTEALTLGTRIAIMRQGHIEQIGTPEEVYNDPKTMFVAGFMGAPPMNLLHVNVKDNRLYVGKDSIFNLNNNNLPENVVLGIRPEKIELGGELRGKIVLKEMLGSYMLLHIEFYDNNLILRTDKEVNGEVVTFNFPGEALYFFDVQSGKRL